LLALAAAYNATGEQEKTEKTYKLYNDIFTKPLPDNIMSSKMIARITQVGDEITASQSFALNEPTNLYIFAIGEGFGSKMFDYGWIEKVSSGDTIWTMTINASEHAGGAEKNRLINASISLRAGKYKLWYTSDDSHSFNRWNAKPPDYAFYGIALYAKSE
jgi:hypothetical protein